MPIRIGIVDDDDHIHDLVIDLLHTVEDVIFVGQAFRGEDALSLCRTCFPDIILMDVRMPGIGGAEATRQLHQAYPKVKVLALSSYRDYEDIKDIMDSGAVGYLTKGSEADDLLDTIRLIHQGKSVFTPEIMQSLVSPPTASPTDSPLTDREQEVLTLMARGLNNRQLAHELGVKVATIRFHIVNIQDKLGAKTRSEALVLAAKQNLI